uniref:Reverse transcriptase domain-containing protein n=1 Tax=Tanacetum cinerariifolium TaxID=118510 RepID=A0A6L2JKU6_TANCI|nr:hypothetical protein [Tanacetum cinerariifolium]
MQLVVVVVVGALGPEFVLGFAPLESSLSQLVLVWCMTRNSTKELLTPFENPKQVLRSRRNLFDTPSLMGSNLPKFDQLSEIEEHIEEEEEEEKEVTEIMTETMKQFMSKTRRDCESCYEPSLYPSLKLQEVILFYNGLDVLTRQILDSRGVIPSKTAADPKIAIQEMAKYSQKWHNETSSKTRTLVDLGASVSVMPFSIYINLDLGGLSHTRLTIEVADRTIKHPRGVAENVLVRIGKFVFPIDFIILDIPEDKDVPLILRQPFLSTAHVKIDVFKTKVLSPPLA